jgi:hypothetical protein
VADAEALGRAALGVHRMGVDYGTSGDAAAALLEEAVDALGDRPGAIRARLLAALARHRYHHRDRRQGAAEAQPLAAEAVAIAERSGDPSALAFALFAQHDTAWQPGTARRRLTIASRMESVSLAAGDAEMRAEAVLLVAIAQLELADPSAIAELERYSRLAFALRERRAHRHRRALRPGVAQQPGGGRLRQLRRRLEAIRAASRAGRLPGRRGQPGVRGRRLRERGLDVRG